MFRKILSLFKMIFNGFILLFIVPLWPWLLLLLVAAIVYFLINEIATYIVIGIGVVFIHVILPFIKS